MLSGARAPIDPPALADDLKEFVCVTQRLSVAQQQMSAVTQSKMHQAQCASLCVRFQINEEISTRDQVDARKRRVTQQVLRSEYNLLAQMFLDPISMLICI